MAHDPVRLDHARLDWEHEKEYKEGILQSEDAPNELKESAAKRINEAKHYLSLIHFEMNHLDPAVDLPEFCDASICIDGNWYYLYYSGPLKDYPYMVEAETGHIPDHSQRTILKQYFQSLGFDISKWETKTTHWYIRKAIKESRK